MNSDFENKLRQHSIRPIPAEWRNEILRNASASVPVEETTASPSIPWWRELLWPCPQAWAGLAVVWVVILGLNVVFARNDTMLAVARPPLTRESFEAFKEEQRLIAQLVDPTSVNHEVAEPPKESAPRPRSERNTSIAMA